MAIKPKKPTMAKENPIGMPKNTSKKKRRRHMRPTIAGSNLRLLSHLITKMKYLRYQLKAYSQSTKWDQELIDEALRLPLPGEEDTREPRVELR